jgi:hypothetical protein
MHYDIGEGPVGKLLLLASLGPDLGYSGDDKGLSGAARRTTRTFRRFIGLATAVSSEKWTGRRTSGGSCRERWKPSKAPESPSLSAAGWKECAQ